MPAAAIRQRIDRFLTDELGVSRATIQRWMKQGRVLRDGNAIVDPSSKVSVGTRLVVVPGPPPPSSAEPDPGIELQVVFEDAHLIVIDKPAGLVVHPGKGHFTGTLVNGLMARDGFRGAPWDERDPKGPLRPGIVHRIDKDTSGLMVVAKTERAREGLMTLFARHDIQRSYLALSVGVPAAGRIETCYGRHPRHRIRFCSTVAVGKRAVTHVEVLEDFRGAAALLRCRLETGRTHQIRVHLSEQRRTPLLADALYGFTPASTVGNISKKLGRQALHAAELGFAHPVTSEQLAFYAEPPPDFQKALERLRQFAQQPA